MIFGESKIDFATFLSVVWIALPIIFEISIFLDV